MILRTILVLLLVSSQLLLSGCEDETAAGSDQVAITVTPGTILGSATASCADRTASGTSGIIVRSLAAPAIYFNNFTLNWFSLTQSFYIDTIRITLVSGRLAGGKKVIDIDSTEIAPLLGVPGAVVGVATTNVATGALVPNKLSSTGTKTGYASCGLAGGSVTLLDPNNASTFSAAATVEIRGLAADANFSNPVSVRKTISTTATFY